MTEIVPVRYRCEHCNDGTTTTEQYDWVDRNATITKGLEDSLMRSLINRVHLNKRRKSPTDFVKRRFFYIERSFASPEYQIVEYGAF